MFDKIKVLIVGYGSIGRRHFNNLIKLGYSNISFVRTMEGTLPDVTSLLKNLFRKTESYNFHKRMLNKSGLKFIGGPTPQNTFENELYSNSKIVKELPTKHRVRIIK